MQFMLSTVYRVTQKDFYARPYTSMWAEMLPHFWMRRLLDVGSEEEVLLPGPLDLRISHHQTLLHGGLLRTLCTGEKFEIWLI